MKHKVIINADDFGYSRAVNYGILDAHLTGILTSTTLMANMEGFEHAVKLKEMYPSLGVGVHLVLTCDNPLIEGHKTISENNKFHKLSKYENNEIEIDENELYAEWKAQIEKVIGAGISPTHLDSHHHIHTFTQMTPTFLKLAEEYNLPIRGNIKVKHNLVTTDYFEARFDDLGFKEELKLSEEKIEDYLEELLGIIKNNKSIEIMTHPAYIDSKLIGNSSFNVQRLGEMLYLTTHEFAKRIMEDDSIVLSTYADLKEEK